MAALHEGTLQLIVASGTASLQLHGAALKAILPTANAWQHMRGVATFLAASAVVWQSKSGAWHQFKLSVQLSHI